MWEWMYGYSYRLPEMSQTRSELAVTLVECSPTHKNVWFLMMDISNELQGIVHAKK